MEESANAIVAIGSIGLSEACFVCFGFADSAEHCGPTPRLTFRVLREKKKRNAQWANGGYKKDRANFG